MEPVRVAVWGTSDVDNYGDHLFPKIAAKELTRRLPGVVVDAYGPLGWLHPTRFDDERTVGPLGPPDEELLDLFADAYDVVLVGGGELVHLNDRMLATVYGTSGDVLEHLAPTRWFVEGLGADRERRCPVVWHGVGVPDALGSDAAVRVRRALEPRSYVTVRDPMSRDRLLDAGVERGVVVVPDSGLLVGRLWDLPGRHARCSYLVVQGCDLVLDHVDDIASAVGTILRRRSELVPLLLETGRCRGDAAFADAMAARLGPVERVDARASLPAIAGVLAGAAGFVGTSLHAAITCSAFGRPFVLANLGGESKLDGFGAVVERNDLVVRDAAGIAEGFERACRAPVAEETVDELRCRIDAHLDRVAAEALSSAQRRAGERDRPQRVDVDRHAARACVTALRGRAEELERLQATRTFRYTARARRAYSTMRARRMSARSRLARRHG